jgi:glycerol-1-phosphate dehydrogenase [NAD(P)+]
MQQQKYFFQAYLDKFSNGGSYDCPCGREHRLGVKRVLLEKGVLEQLPELVRELCGSSPRIWILSDENTERAAAGACKQLLARFVLGELVLPAQPRPRTDPELIAALVKEAGGFRPDLIIAVGGGTISDIGKKVSQGLDAPNWCVATAASVDAYSSGTSALKLKNGHRSEPARPSEVIIADLSVLEQAPKELSLAGFGDLLGKYLAYLDWHLSSMITGEYLCPEAAALALDSTRRAIQALERGRSGGDDTVRSLADAILASGFAMQGLLSSRPASSAEHTVAHFWEAAGTAGNRRYGLHGLLVGLSSRLLLEVYRDFYRSLPALELDISERLEHFEAEAHWEHTLTPAVKPFRTRMREEMAAGTLDVRGLEEHLLAIGKNRKRIAGLAAKLLAELAAAVRVLEKDSFPFSLPAFGIVPEQALRPYRYVRYLRNRYGTFHLIYEAGREEAMLDCIAEQISLLS